MESNAGECSTVPKQLTGTFLASTDGFWEGQLGFNYTKALYSFEFTNATFQQGDYEQFIQTVQNAVTSAGTYTQLSNLAVNLMYLVGADFPIPVLNNYQYVQLTGAPSIIFNREGISSTLIGAPSIPGETYTQCSAQYNDANFNTATSKFQLTYDITDFNAAQCGNILPLLQFFGYIPPDQASFLLDVDMISFSIAYSLNFGSLDPSSLEQIAPGEVIPTITFNSVVYEFTQFYDIRFPGMTPIGCLIRPGGFFFCVLEVMGTFVLPIINPYGDDFDNPVPCEW